MPVPPAPSGRADRRALRHRRLRARVHGTAERPRLSVFRSARHLAVQLVDDDAGRTLIGLTDAHVKSEARSGEDGKRGVARARALGKLVAEQARAKGMTTVVFDRGGYAYHGQVQAVADGARAGGLQF